MFVFVYLLKRGTGHVNSAEGKSSKHRGVFRESDQDIR